MSRKIRLTSCTLLAIISLGLLVMATLRSEPLESNRSAQPDETGAFMRAKLASSQKILEGLATKKFGLIQDGAKELQKLSDAAGKGSSNDVVNLHYSREFRRLMDKLDRLAEGRNLEGASLVYMQMVSTCLRCHEHTRHVLGIPNDQQESKSPFRLLRKEEGKAILHTASRR